MKKISKIRRERREKHLRDSARLYKGFKESFDGELLFKFTFDLDSENREHLGAVGVTRTRILVACEGENDGDAVNLQSFCISDFSEFKARSNIGTVALEGKRDGEWLEICRSSMTYAPYIIDAARCLETLLEFVTNPYFTDENVEKERGIIEQEIKMYKDNPSNMLFYTLLRLMYKDHPIRTEISGTVRSISTITKEVLYDAYNAFYSLDNMALCISGDVDANAVERIADKILKKSPQKTLFREYHSEAKMNVLLIHTYDLLRVIYYKIVK